MAGYMTRAHQNRRQALPYSSNDLNGAIHARVDCHLTLHQRLAKS